MGRPTLKTRTAGEKMSEPLRESLESYLKKAVEAISVGNLKGFVFFIKLSLMKIDVIMKSVLTVKSERARNNRRGYVEAAQEIIREMFLLVKNWIDKETNQKQDPGDIPWETNEWKEQQKGENP